MKEPRPNSYQMGMIQRLWMQRGRYITAYAQVEDLSGRLYVHALKLEEYRGLSADFPYRVETRFKRLEALTSMAGPLAAYANDLRTICTELPKFERVRNFLAHGLLIAETSTRRRRNELQFRMFEARKGAAPEPMIFVTTTEALKGATDEMCTFAQWAVSRFRHIFLTHDL